MNNRRLTGRDYKRPRNNGFGGLRVDLTRYRDLAIGLGVGLCIAAAVYVADHRAPEPVSQTPPRPTPRAAASMDAVPADSSGPDATPTSPAVAESKYDFYQMLPKFEVVVSEKERGTRVAPTAQIDRPGTYFLQVGSYRDADVAERVHAQLTKLGIDATVQRIAVDNDVWRRVRIGPIKDLAKLNRTRAQLRASELDSLVIRVDD